MRGKIDGIQVLRGVAATLVLCRHVGLELHDDLGMFWPDWLTIGGLGVGIFFVISGFIMVHVSRDEFGSIAAGGRFLLRRVIRIVPMYWLCTMVLVALQKSGYFLKSTPAYTPYEIGSSLFFIPTGWPLLYQGWTLNYEMYFYLIFALWLCIAKPRFGPYMVIATIIAIFVVTASLFGLPDRSQDLQFFGKDFFANPTPLIFCIGIGLALWARRGKSRQWGRVPLVIGDASYSIYLTHPFVLMAFGKFWKITGTGFLFPAPLWSVIMIPVAIVAGVCAFYLVERPMTRYLQARFSPKRAVSVAAV